MDVVALVTAAAARSQGLATRAGLQRAGCSDGTLARAVAGGSLVRVRPRVYAVGPLPPRPRLAVTDSGPASAYVLHVRAALLSMGPEATACRRTAAALRGWGMLVEPTRLLEVAVAHGRSRVRAKDVRPVQRRAVDRVRLTVGKGSDGLWVTSAVQTVVDCALDLPLVEAVVVCDSALRAADVTVEELRLAAGSFETSPEGTCGSTSASFTWAEVVHDTARVLEDVRVALGCGCPSFPLRSDEVETAA